jgi:hypothetical protein
MHTRCPARVSIDPRHRRVARGKVPLSRSARTTAVSSHPGHLDARRSVRRRPGRRGAARRDRPPRIGRRKHLTEPCPSGQRDRLHAPLSSPNVCAMTSRQGRM